MHPKGEAGLRIPRGGVVTGTLAPALFPGLRPGCRRGPSSVVPGAGPTLSPEMFRPQEVLGGGRRELGGAAPRWGRELDAGEATHPAHPRIPLLPQTSGAPSPELLRSLGAREAGGIPEGIPPPPPASRRPRTHVSARPAPNPQLHSVSRLPAGASAV